MKTRTHEKFKASSISQSHLNTDDIPRESVDPRRLRRHRADRYTCVSSILGENDRLKTTSMKDA
eukprot:6177620-Pleurochrysis_carterae.AAC.2